MKHVEPIGNLKSARFTWRCVVASRHGPHSTTRHVLLTLSLHMSEKGDSCFPSTATLAEETGLTERTVCTHLERAFKEGWIIKEQVGFAGQRWRKHQYIAQVPREAADGFRRDRLAEANEAKKGAEGNSVPSESEGDESLSKGTEPNAKGTESSSEGTEGDSVEYAIEEAKEGSQKRKPKIKKGEAAASPDPDLFASSDSPEQPKESEQVTLIESGPVRDGEAFGPDSMPYKAAKYFFDRLYSTGVASVQTIRAGNDTKTEEETLQAWAEVFDKMHRLRGVSWHDVGLIGRWLFDVDDWWITEGNFESAAKLYRKNRDGVYYWQVFLTKARAAASQQATRGAAAFDKLRREARERREGAANSR